MRSLTGPLLAHELIEALLGHRAIACGIDIGAMVGARRLAVDENAKADRLAAVARPQHEMQIARMEAIGDPAVARIERRALAADRPICRSGPIG